MYWHPFPMSDIMNRIFSMSCLCLVSCVSTPLESGDLQESTSHNKYDRGWWSQDQTLPTVQQHEGEFLFSTTALTAQGVFSRKKAPAGASTRSTGLVYTQKYKKVFFQEKKTLRERPPAAQDLYTPKQIKEQ